MFCIPGASSPNIQHYLGKQNVVRFHVLKSLPAYNIQARFCFLNQVLIDKGKADL